MALVQRSKIQKLKELGHLKPEEETGLYLSAEDAKSMGAAQGDEDQVVIIKKQVGKPQKRPTHAKGWWPEKKKIEAATLYAATGSIPRVADLCKVPVNTIREWVKEDWFLQTLARVKREESFETDRKFTKIVDKALDQLQDRIENGEYVYDIRQGKAVNVPMNGRDLAIVTGTIFDKRQLIRGEATKITEAVNSDEHLEKLAVKFKEFLKEKKSKELPVIDVEVIESPDEA